MQQSEIHECIILLPKDLVQGDHGTSSILTHVLRGPLRQSVRLNVLLPLEMLTRFV